MIEWKEYQQNDRSIVSHTNYIVSNGEATRIAQRAYIHGQNKYHWLAGNSILAWVTHYAEINLPKIKLIEIEDDPNQANLEL